MRIGIRVESLGLSVRQALAVAAEIGATGVQFDAVGALSPQELSQTGRRELRNLLRSYNLELTALGCPLRYGLDVADGLQPRLDQLRQVMTLSFDLGPRLTIIDGPPVPCKPTEAEKTPFAASMLTPGLSGGILLGTRPGNRDSTLREALADLGAHGDRTGTALALETGLSPGAELAAFLASFDTGALGVNYDPANMLLNGFDPIQELLPLRGRILHTHARDARAASAGRAAGETALGAGQIDWMAYVGVLESLEYRGWLVVERDAGPHSRADVAQGVAFLKRFVR